jgi:hypothetical protein
MFPTLRTGVLPILEGGNHEGIWHEIVLGSEIKGLTDTSSCILKKGSLNLQNIRKHMEPLEELTARTTTARQLMGNGHTTARSRGSSINAGV